jgi:hypothetical protein
MRSRVRAKTDKPSEYCKEFSEVRYVWSTDEANILMKDGWTLACAGIAHKDDGGYQAKPCFILKR